VKGLKGQASHDGPSRRESVGKERDGGERQLGGGNCLLYSSKAAAGPCTRVPQLGGR
jgi:hypothetical protein